MTLQSKIIVAIVALTVAFASGRYLTPEKIKTEIKTVEIEKVVTVVEKKVVTIKEKPDGSKETTIVTDTKTDTKTDKTSTTASKEESKKNSTMNVALMVGTPIGFNITQLDYGLSVSKELVGPVTVGAWVLTNKSIGASVGLNF